MLAKTNILSSSYTKHNKAHLVRGGREYFDLLLKLISEAKNSIHFHVYIFDEDETGRQVADALLNAVQRGVRVYLMVDGYATVLSGPFIEKLQKGGIRFKMFEPIFHTKHFYFGRRMHHKVLVTDAYHTLVGGINVSNKYNDLDSEPAWLDWSLYAQGEIAIELLKICINLWTRSSRRRKELFSNEKLPEHFPFDKCLIRPRRNDWVQRKTQITNSYFEMFRAAHSHITIMSSYFLPGIRFKQRLGKASKRGVNIKLILAGISDIRLSKHAERYIYRWLLRNGIQIFEWQKTILHGKMASYDGEFVTLGSYNVNNLSAYVSLELNLDIKDRGLAATVEKELERIISEECKQITEEDCRHFNFFQRMAQFTAYSVMRFLFFIFTFYFKQRNL